MTTPRFESLFQSFSDTSDPARAAPRLAALRTELQRRGLDGDGGLVLVMNGGTGAWRGAAVTTAFAGRRMVPVAHGSTEDPGVPNAKTTDAAGNADFWAPPRGYAVYVPEATP